MRNCRSRDVATGFAIGLLSAWSILWSATLIIFNDAPRAFKRIERRESGPAANGVPNTASNATTDGAMVSGGEKATSGIDARTTLLTKKSKSRTESIPSGGGRLVFAHKTGSFAWQNFPKSITERLDWVSDLVCNFRGMGWNWRISGLPPPPSWVQEQLQRNDGTKPEKGDSHVGPTGNVRYHTTRNLLRHKLLSFVVGYLVLDVCKVVMMLDPYFWGVFDRPPPSYLPAIIATSSTVLRTYRLVFTLLAIYTALQTIFFLGPLLFVGLIGPKYIGARGEPWMYPDAFGSYRSIFDKGLAGWWGGWWHQTFRFAFDSSSNWAVAKLGWDRKSLKGKVLHLLIAFSLSGSLHACGSYTMWPPTQPLRGPFLFFFLQTWGIIGQMFAAKVLQRCGITSRTPKLLRQLTNFLYVHVWFYYTAPLLVDDFARGGIWLFEPVPISLLRGLGFGLEGEGWWRWGGVYLRWHRGRRWWESGVAV
ncbi:MAG: hypothetical protein M1830_009199 [Pleopsidium flavum]|nr:MAG: hypothetical protein M1830_009199 [Pleopsidium flavum]